MTVNEIVAYSVAALALAAAGGAGSYGYAQAHKSDGLHPMPALHEEWPVDGGVIKCDWRGSEGTGPDVAPKIGDHVVRDCVAVAVATK